MFAAIAIGVGLVWAGLWIYGCSTDKRRGEK